MHKRFLSAIALATALILSRPAAAQDARLPYTDMAPAERYLMNRDAEIALARSAAPDTISRDASVLVLTGRGYEYAVQGKNGFVCMVGRSWTAAFDWPEFWNPKVRAADCMNPQAARWVLPMALLRSRMVMAGHSKAEILSAIQAGFEARKLPQLESGAMDYMMSKSSYLTDQGDHSVPHVMFYTAGIDAKDWGSGAEGSPVMGAPYWFFTPEEPSKMKGLPPIVVFLVMVPDWADGTPAGKPDRNRDVKANP